MRNNLKHPNWRDANRLALELEQELCFYHSVRKVNKCYQPKVEAI